MKFTYAMAPFRTRFDIFLAPPWGDADTRHALLVLYLYSSCAQVPV